LNGEQNTNQELQLIKEASLGNEAAFSELFQKYYSFLYKYLLKMTLNPHVSEEILQDVMLKSFLNMKQFDNRSKFSTWLMSIATRTYIDYLRKMKRERLLFRKKEKEFSNEQLKWYFYQHGYEFNEVLEIIRSLDPMFRIPLLLKHYYGYSYEEISNMLQIKEGTVKSRVHKSLRVVREELKGNE